MGVGAGLTCPEFSRWSETLNFLQRLGNLVWTSLPEIGIVRSGGTRHQEATLRVPEAGPDPKQADRKGVMPLARARAKRAQGSCAADSAEWWKCVALASPYDAGPLI